MLRASTSFQAIHAPPIEVDIMEYVGTDAKDKIPALYKVLSQEDELILYGSRTGTQRPAAGFPVYNLILRLQLPHGAPPDNIKLYSLFRSDQMPEAIRVFTVFKEVFPELLKATSASAPFDKATLERIMKISSRHQDFTGLHVATALEMVDQLRSPVFRERLENEGKLWGQLKLACVLGKLEAFRALTEIGSRRIMDHLQSTLDNEGNTVLHLAAASEDHGAGVHILKLFKQKILTHKPGKKVRGYRGDGVLTQMFRMYNAHGYAPIHLACLSHNLEAVVELSTVTDVAEANGSFTAVRSPSSRNLIDIRDANGHAPLHLSISQPAILSRLLGMGADPNSPDKHRATPLHLASAVGAVESMKALISAGADKDSKNDKALTPRQIVETAYEGPAALKNEALAILAGGH